MNEKFTDLEKGKLFALCQDKAMMAALKKVMLSDIYSAGVVTKDNDGSSNWAYNIVYGSINGQMVDHGRTNEELGEVLRAVTMGITMLNSAFKRVEEFDVKEVKNEPEVNKAL